MPDHTPSLHAEDEAPPAAAAAAPKTRFGVRHQQSLLLFCLLFFCNALRTNLSVGIVAMTDHTTNESFEVSG